MCPEAASKWSGQVLESWFAEFPLKFPKLNQKKQFKNELSSKTKQVTALNDLHIILQFISIFFSFELIVILL
jgi:hypothetical protein